MILAHLTSTGDHFGVTGRPGVRRVTKVWILDDFREKKYLGFDSLLAPLEVTFFILGGQGPKNRDLCEASVARSLFLSIFGQILGRLGR